MHATDRAAFGRLLHSVYAYYRQQCSEFALQVWWQAMQQYDLETVRETLGRHATNPDNGQFLPKVADVVKLIQGSTLDAAQLAWTKVLNAIASVGTYETVCFDDPIINAVLSDMGGWILLGQVDVEELPFKAREFEQRYRGYKTRGGASAYPRSLPGIFDQGNGAQGYGLREPVLIGDTEKARLVYTQGDDGQRLTFAPLSRALPRLEEKTTA